MKKYNVCIYTKTGNWFEDGSLELSYQFHVSTDNVNYLKNKIYANIDEITIYTRNVIIKDQKGNDVTEEIKKEW